MKTWRKKYEWTSYAACADNPLHTAEMVTGEDLEAQDEPGVTLTDISEAQKVCQECRVRPECIEWAIREKACAVVVAGKYLPDPFFKKELRAAYNELQKSLPSELEKRGEV